MTKWEKIASLLDNCQDPHSNNLHWILVAHIERTLEEFAASENDEKILREVLNLLYHGIEIDGDFVLSK